MDKAATLLAVFNFFRAALLDRDLDSLRLLTSFVSLPLLGSLLVCGLDNGSKSSAVPTLFLLVSARLS